MKGTINVNRAHTKDWDTLLKGFLRLASSEGTAGQISFDTLLREFEAAERLVQTRQSRELRQDQVDFKNLLQGYETGFRRWRKRQARIAEDFNLVELLGMVRDENRHSNVLAWLLNADVYSATHSQGDLGFRAFLNELGLPVNYANGSYRVGREIQSEESRIDIEILAHRRFVIHIEAKVGSGEGVAQLEREWRDLKRTAGANLIDESHIHAFYLAPGGKEPSYDHFKPISWLRVARIFEEFAKNAKAESVRWFANHYAQALRKFVVQRREEESLND